MNNILRKASCLLMVLALMFSLAACGGSGDADNSVIANSPEVEKLVAEQGADMETACEESFALSSGGMTCECDVYAQGTAIVMDIRIDGFDDCSDELKQQFQEAYDATEEVLEAQFAPLKDEVGELTAVIYNVCEEDGDILASVTVDIQ